VIALDCVPPEWAAEAVTRCSANDREAAGRVCEERLARYQAEREARLAGYRRRWEAPGDVLRPEFHKETKVG